MCQIIQEKHQPYQSMGNRGKEKISSLSLFPIICDKISCLSVIPQPTEKASICFRMIPFPQKGTTSSEMSGYNPLEPGHCPVHWDSDHDCVLFPMLLILVSGLIHHGKCTAYYTSHIFLLPEVPQVSLLPHISIQKQSSYLEQVKSSDRNKIAPKASPLFPREPIQNDYLQHSFQSWVLSCYTCTA